MNVVVHIASEGAVNVGSTALSMTLPGSIVAFAEPLLPKGDVVRFEGTSSDGGNRESVVTRSPPEPGPGLGLALGALGLVAGRARRRAGRDGPPAVASPSASRRAAVVGRADAAG